MSTPSFSGIPSVLREKIYYNILTTQPENLERVAPASPLCKLLTVSRQVHDEALQILRRQLPVLVQTNDVGFIKLCLKHKIPVISQLRSQDGQASKDVTGAPVAMEMEFYVYHNYLPAQSYPAFLLSRGSIPDLARATGIYGDFYFWSMQASLSLSLLRPFYHTPSQAQELLARPWLQTFLAPSFVGLSTNPAVDLDMATKLKERIVGIYTPKALLGKLRSLQHGALQKASSSSWDEAAQQFEMARRFARMAWECHLQRMVDGEEDEDPDMDCVRHLWVVTCDVGANNTQVLLNAAAGSGGQPPPPPRVPASNDIPTGAPGRGRSDERFARARRAAEDTIRLLRACPAWAGDVEDAATRESVLLTLRKHRAQVSFRAHAACKGMGDVPAALGYLRQALKYEPESSQKLLPRIEALEAEGARDQGNMAIFLWED